MQNDLTKLNNVRILPQIYTTKRNPRTLKKETQKNPKQNKDIKEIKLNSILWRRQEGSKRDEGEKSRESGNLHTVLGTRWD
jgi:hypothetical protein